MSYQGGVKTDQTAASIISSKYHLFIIVINAIIGQGTRNPFNH